MDWWPYTLVEITYWFICYLGTSRPSWLCWWCPWCLLLIVLTCTWGMTCLVPSSMGARMPLPLLVVGSKGASASRKSRWSDRSRRSSYVICAKIFEDSFRGKFGRKWWRCSLGRSRLPWWRPSHQDWRGRLISSYKSSNWRPPYSCRVACPDTYHQWCFMLRSRSPLEVGCSDHPAENSQALCLCDKYPL